MACQKIHGPIQVGKTALGSPKQLIIPPPQKRHAYRSLISLIPKEFSEEGTSLRACNLQLQCSWTLWRITSHGSQYLQCHLTYFLFVLCQQTHKVLPSHSNLWWWHLSEEVLLLMQKRALHYLPA